MERVSLRRDPDWWTLPAAAGAWWSLDLPSKNLRATLTARIWSPAGNAGRVLVAHDGPDYDKHAGLGRYVAASITAGRVEPCHVVLLPAGDRNEWYAALPAYARGLGQEILPQLTDRLSPGRPVAAVGASVGALALLHCQRRHPEVFAGLFLQSGSFFQPRFDRQESGFARYLPIVRWTGRVLRAPDGPGVPVTMTCGRLEENLANNRSMAEALRAQGYPVTFAQIEGGHDWPAWRDALEPHLTSLLRRLTALM
ncbi:alpha/beta hydrolase [Paractinoplanes hotanensis]|uniref:Alpha/beta hydrolase-fold protein n=1 Tax=Paractinoplanes hotanensis TaxID=2906497 RepID=A0ABT0Y2J1_9ACTN|nr:alpha/beta hydrolase-fold protein [Actinoplanes hotanensis]MCM4079728.1 alpha/beta hydrolase-fold protein [Actinoplanes hotanensis]